MHVFVPPVQVPPVTFEHVSLQSPLVGGGLKSNYVSTAFMKVFGQE